MLVPARNTNAGAQKWVIQRVKNTAAVGPPAGTPEKTLTWSIAIRIMTAPRMRSMDAMRVFEVVSMAVEGAVRVALMICSLGGGSEGQHYTPECFDGGQNAT